MKNEWRKQRRKEEEQIGEKYKGGVRIKIMSKKGREKEKREDRREKDRRGLIFAIQYITSNTVRRVKSE